jgi:Tfp pilus assembly protein PilV
MTLLEALVALVILGVSVVGYLDVFQSGARSLQQADEWERTVAVAESTMESVLLDEGDTSAGGDEGFTRTVSVNPWSSGVSEIVVSVRSPRGSLFVVRRLARLR